VWRITRLDCEDRAKVTWKELRACVLLDGSDDARVDLLLKGNARIWDLLLASSCGLRARFLCSSEEAASALGALLAQSALEQFRVDLFQSLDIDARKSNLCGSRDDVALVDTADRDAIVLVRARHDERASLELLQHNCVATTVLAGKHDRNGAWRNATFVRASDWARLADVLGLLAG